LIDLCRKYRDPRIENERRILSKVENENENGGQSDGGKK
jgi:hypothetical protein